MNHFATITPLLRLPRGMDTFDYRIPDDMHVTIGSLVKIPFRKQAVFGLVTGLAETTKFNAQPIDKVILRDAINGRYGMTFLTRLQEETCAPLSLLARTFSPQVPRRDIDALPKTRPVRCGNGYTSLALPTESVDAIRAVVTGSAPSLLWWHRLAERVVTIVKLLERLPKDGAALVLFPNQKQLESMLSMLPHTFAASTAVITSAASPRMQFATWWSIALGEKKIVFGTRTALLAPLHNLQTIVLDGEEMYGWKEEQNPRYDARIAARVLADVSGARLIALSAAPPVASSLSQSITPRPASTTHIIDLKELFADKNFSSLGRHIREQITALGTKNYGVIFLNRKGYGALMACGDCKNAITCSDCTLPMTHHRANATDTLSCHHCRAAKSVPLSCPLCASPRLQSLGKGLDRLAATIQEDFPGRRVELMTHFGINILPWRTTPPAFIGVIDALQGMHLPEYTTLEKTFQFLYKGSMIAAAWRIPYIVQSFSIDHPLFAALRSNDPELFYTEERKDRERRGYPPFTRLAKLIIRDADSDVARSAAMALAKQLASQTVTADVIPAHPPRQRGRSIFYVVVRFDRTIAPQSILIDIPTSVVIELDPETLL
jgi:primosomal protein N' (replication factor Y) (superfamily II helicase)